MGLPVLIISTHTLTWSVTEHAIDFGPLHNISTHTLTWSVTVLTYSKNNDDDISTHTLTWSVTRPAVGLTAVKQHFNSHAHVERDPFCSAKLESLSISTHTLTWSVTQGQRQSKRVV